MKGYQVHWAIDDARFTDCDGCVFHTTTEAIIAITLSVMSRKAELMNEYEADKMTYDCDLKKTVELTFPEWIGVNIDNFCDLQCENYWHEYDFDTVGA